MIDQQDPGYANYRDPRLIPDNTSEPDMEDDAPATAEFRALLDTLGIAYSCGWEVACGEGDTPRRVDVHDVTHVKIGNDTLSFDEDDEPGECPTLYLDYEAYLTPVQAAGLVELTRNPRVIVDLREACARLVQSARVAESMAECRLLDARFAGELEALGVKVSARDGNGRD